MSFTINTVLIFLVCLAILNWGLSYYLKLRTTTVDLLQLIQIINSTKGIDKADIEILCNKVISEFPYFVNAVEAVYVYRYVLSILNKHCSPYKEAGLSPEKLYGLTYINIYNQDPSVITKAAILMTLYMRIKILSVINYPSVPNDIRISILETLQKTPNNTSELIVYKMELLKISDYLKLNNKKTFSIKLLFKSLYEDRKWKPC